MNILKVFENAATNFSDKVAIADENEKITFFKLRERAKSLASALIRNDIKNQPIGIFAQQNIQTIVSMLAVLYSGNFFVLIDPESPSERLEKIYHESSLNYCLKYDISSKEVLLLNLVDKEKNFSLVYDTILYDEINCIINATNSNDNAYVVFTSGSTGIPKGVAKSHACIISFAKYFSQKFNITNEDVIGNQSPFYFDASMKDVILMIYTGATLQLIPKKLFMFPLKLVDYLVINKVSIFLWVPSALSIFAQLKIFENFKDADGNFVGNPLPNLKQVFFVGEVFPIKYLNYWLNHFPKVDFYNIYGSSETAGVVCYYKIPGELNENTVLPIGKPLPQVKCLILNEDNKECKVGELGELCIAGEYLATCYYNRSDETQKKFTQNPLNMEKEIIYHTGDIVLLDENENIVYAGRKDFQIKHMGQRIELGEIETAIMSLDYIKETCVVYNVLTQKIIAYCVSNISADDLNKTIKKDLSNKLSSYMMPNKIVFEDELKKNQNLKIDRHYYVTISKGV